ncbi:hypothetical protein GIB67_018540, partial [Kingdonia uniflora]
FFPLVARDHRKLETEEYFLLELDPQLQATYGNPEYIIVTEVKSFKQIGLQINPD